MVVHFSACKTCDISCMSMPHTHTRHGNASPNAIRCERKSVHFIAFRKWTQSNERMGEMCARKFVQPVGFRTSGPLLIAKDIETILMHIANKNEDVSGALGFASATAMLTRPRKRENKKLISLSFNCKNFILADVSGDNFSVNFKSSRVRLEWGSLTSCTIWFHFYWHLLGAFEWRKFDARKMHENTNAGNANENVWVLCQ